MAFLFSVGFCDLRFEKTRQKTAPAPEAVLCLTPFRQPAGFTSTVPEYIFPSSLSHFKFHAVFFPPVCNYETLHVTLCPKPKVLTPSERKTSALLWGLSVTDTTFSLATSDLQ